MKMFTRRAKIREKIMKKADRRENHAGEFEDEAVRLIFFIREIEEGHLIRFRFVRFGHTNSFIFIQEISFHFRQNTSKTTSWLIDEE